MEIKGHSQLDEDTKLIDCPKNEGIHFIQLNSVKSKVLTSKDALLFKLGMFFLGITALTPNSVLLSDMDFFIYMVLNNLDYCYLVEKS